MTNTDRLNAWVRQCASAPERGIDRAEVRRALSIFVDPEQTFCLQSLPSARWQVCSGSDLDAAVEAAYELSDGTGVYWTLNPCRAGLAKMPVNGDIVGRRWLLIDVDRRAWKIPGQSDTNATDAEKLLVTEVAYKASDWLYELGWPNPVMVDSGNGNHLYYRVDLPNDPLSRAILKAVLTELKRRFDTDKAEIDGKVIDARRITKLPGTWARKGPHSDDRPHRLARLVMVPDEVEAVSLELLQAAGGTPQTSSHEPPSVNGATAFVARSIRGGLNLTNYVRRTIELECAHIEMAGSEGRNNILNEAAHSLGTMDWWPEMDAQVAREALRIAACRAGLDTDPNCGPLGIARTIESGWSVGVTKPRPRPEPEGAKPKIATANGAKVKLTIGLDEIVPEKVDWLWEDRLAPGFISIFAGRTGLGKSFTLCDVAARLSRGEPPPFSSLRRGVVRTLFISEDPLKQMLGPRLIEMGANRKMIRFMTWEAMGLFTLSNVDMLNTACAEFDEHPGFLIIDPPTNFLGKVDENGNAEIRQALKALITWLDTQHVCCGLITHINKAIGKGLDAVERIVGSIAWGSMARITVAFARDPDDAGVLICGGTKNNLGELAQPLAYRILKTDTLARIEWIGKSDINMEDAMNKIKRKTRGMCAVEWLTEQYRARRTWESEELKKAAAQCGISKNALWSSEARALPITKKPHTDAAGDVTWFWTAQPGWPPDLPVENTDRESWESGKVET